MAEGADTGAVGDRESAVAAGQPEHENKGYLVRIVGVF